MLHKRHFLKHIAIFLAGSSAGLTSESGLALLRNLPSLTGPQEGKAFLTKRTLWINDTEKNATFVNNYLSNCQFQMRSQLANMPGNFWKSHGDSIRYARDTKNLLFRAKVQRRSRNVIEIVNLWSSQQFYRQSYQQCNGQFFTRQLSQIGFSSRIVGHSVSLSWAQTHLPFYAGLDPSTIEINQLDKA